MSGTAKATVLVENERVVVTEWRMAPGTDTGWHRHERDYVVVPLADGTLKLETKEGVIVSDARQGAPYFRGQGVEHNVINAGAREYVFIEVELK